MSIRDTALPATSLFRWLAGPWAHFRDPDTGETYCTHHRTRKGKPTAPRLTDSWADVGCMHCQAKREKLDAFPHEPYPTAVFARLWARLGEDFARLRLYPWGGESVPLPAKDAAAALDRAADMLEIVREPIVEAYREEREVGQQAYDAAYDAARDAGEDFQGAYFKARRAGDRAVKRHRLGLRVIDGGEGGAA